MTAELAGMAWPLSRLGEAVEALAHAADLVPAAQNLEMTSPPRDLDEAALSRWLEATALWLGVETQPVTAPYTEVASFIRGGAPALVRLGDGETAEFIAVSGAGKDTVTILDPTRTPRRVKAAVIERVLVEPLERKMAPELASVLQRVSASRQSKVRDALLRGRLESRLIRGLWLLRSAPSAKLGHVATKARLPQLIGALALAHVVEYVVVLASWWAASNGALQGRFDSGWLIAWVLLLLTLVPLRFFGAWCASRFSIGVGTLLKTRLLVGALKLDSNAIRHRGAGQLLGQVIESSAIETLGLSGGLISLVAIVEVGICCVVLAEGTGGWLHVLMYLTFVVFAALLAWRYYGRRRHWTKVRLAMTHDLVERMVGHRTRIAQEWRERWHDGEDQVLERYLVASRPLDHQGVLLAIVPRGWLLFGIGVLVPQLVTGSPSTLPLAVALGGILLGHGALQSLTAGITLASGAAIAWDEARPLMLSAATVSSAPVPVAATTTEIAPRPQERAVVLKAEDLRFRYREQGEPVLRGCSLRIHSGDRLLLEGPSGGGKSTLGALLTGLRVPESGLLLLGGLDRNTLGAEGWRRRVVAAPQFHENHVFSATFAFNLLMGRAWPPSYEDLIEAEGLCRELDLGPLLDRMPAGLQQMVGETGWQLSHGEKSRLYIARALLQRADLVVLDESFAALDPETLQRALQCVLARAPTLFVIAHP
jgi:ATP-binding cassette subfamily B protein